MYEVIYENMKQFGVLKDLSGLEKLNTRTNNKAVGILKLYFDLDELDNEKKVIHIETEDISDKAKGKYIEFTRASSSKNFNFNFLNQNYLFGQYKKNNEYIGVSEQNITPFSFEEFLKKNFKEADEELKTSINEILNICKKIQDFYFSANLPNDKGKQIKAHILDLENIIFKIGNDEAKFTDNNYKEYIFSLGFTKNKKECLFIEYEDYLNVLNVYSNISERSTKQRYGVCDFCQNEGNLVENFGSKPYELSELKQFTTTQETVFYQLNKNSIERTFRCCLDCFNKINQCNQEYRKFYVGRFREQSYSKKRVKDYHLFGYVDNLVKEQDIEFSFIEDAFQSLFGENNNAIQSLIKIGWNSDIFDEKLIFNLFAVYNTNAGRQIVLNLRNLNPNLLRNYSRIFRQIIILSNRKVYNFNSIFSFLSKADKKITFQTIDAFLSNKSLNENMIIKMFLPLLRHNYLASLDDIEINYYNYLVLDIFYLFIVNNLRRFEKMKNFEDNIFFQKKEDINKDENKEIKYERFATDIIVKNLGFNWTNLEVALLELGMVLNDIMYNISKSKKTDIKKVFFSKLKFSGMSKADVMTFIAFIESKIMDYRKLIFGLEEKQTKLAEIGLLLNGDENISKERCCYLILLGYELSINIGLRISKDKKGE